MKTMGGDCGRTSDSGNVLVTVADNDSKQMKPGSTRAAVVATVDGYDDDNDDDDKGGGGGDKEGEECDDNTMMMMMMMMMDTMTMTDDTKTMLELMKEMTTKI